MRIFRSQHYRAQQPHVKRVRARVPSRANRTLIIYSARAMLRDGARRSASAAVIRAPARWLLAVLATPIELNYVRAGIRF